MAHKSGHKKFGTRIGNLFKSKEQRNKDKLKKELQSKIANVGTNRNVAGKKKRLQRELKAVDAPKKEKKKSYGRAATAYGTRDKIAAKTEVNNKSKSKSSTKVGGKKLSNYEMKVAERRAVAKQKAGAKHLDWKKMKSGGMSREDFIKKYPRSGTARKYGKK